MCTVTGLTYPAKINRHGITRITVAEDYGRRQVCHAVSDIVDRRTGQRQGRYCRGLGIGYLGMSAVYCIDLISARGRAGITEKI